MASSNFQGSVTAQNVITGLHASGGGTITNNFASPQPNEAEVLRREKEACLQSLIYPNMGARHDDIADAHPDTCNWLFSTPEFEKWRDRIELPTHNGVLWIKGKPGVGKSTLMKHAVRHYEDIFPDHLIVAYFFNARGDILEKTPQGLWQSIVYQLLNKDPILYESFVPIFRDMQRTYKNENWAWKQSQLKQFVTSAIKKWKSTPLLFLVDALDECNEKDVRDVVNFLESLSTASTKAGAIVRISLSSRHYPTITMKKTLELIMEKHENHRADIAAYIKERLRTQESAIENKLLDKADGIFMWVVLVVSLLNKAYDEGRIEAMQNALEEVPDDLEALFILLLRKDDPTKGELILMLQWVLLSGRPLRPEELYIAAVGASLPTADAIERRITNSSNGLIEIRKGGDSVQFIHLSVNDFLLRNKRLQTLAPMLEPDPISASHGQLWTCCWSYIEQLDMECIDKEEGEDLLKHYPFVEYTLTYMFDHADKALIGRIQNKRFKWWNLFSKSRGTSSCQEFIKQVLQTLEKLFPRWKIIMDVTKLELLVSAEEVDVDADSLYTFSYEGYQNLVKALVLGKEIDINTKNGNCGNALQAACYRGNEAIVQLLVEKGADINAQGGCYGNALQAAAYYGENKAIVQLLVEKGADVNAQGGYYGNALQAACHRGNEAIVQLLVKKGANINAQGGYYGNALQAACRFREENLVRLLLEEGADVNAQGGYYGNALQAACYRGNEAVAQLLVEKGANINAQGGYYGNTLQAACYRGNKAIVQLLVEKGANINAQGGYYGNTLQAACHKGNEVIVQLLVKKGTDINAQGGYFGNALQAAVCYGENKAIAQLLVEKGANINVQGGYYGNALQAACYGRDKAVAKLLVEKGANINAQGGYYGNALQAAVCFGGNKAFIQLLVEKGANVNAQGGYYGNALQAACRFGAENLVRLLLEEGADVNAQGGKHGNALQAASDKKDEAIISILLENGADIKTLQVVD